MPHLQMSFCLKISTVWNTVGKGRRGSTLEMGANILLKLLLLLLENLLLTTSEEGSCCCRRFSNLHLSLDSCCLVNARVVNSPNIRQKPHCKIVKKSPCFPVSRKSFYDRKKIFLNFRFFFFFLKMWTP